MRLYRTLTLVVLLMPGVAAADGELTLRGVWYKEKATRVIQPMMDARFDAGEDGEVDAHLLVDAITSASVAAGAINAPFSERRYEVGGGYTRQIAEDWRGGISARISHEPDYDSVFAGLHVERALFSDNLVVGLTAGGGFDAISNAGVPVGMATPIHEEMKTALGSVSISQVVSPHAVIGLTYDLSMLRGYQANPYRSAITAEGLVPERHPDERLRHAVAASLRWFVARTESTVIASWREYRDDWGLRAHTPELRIVQQAGDGIDFSVRYRYHRQSDADFFLPSYPSNDLDEFPYVTDDVKLSAFDSHTIGFKLAVLGGVIGFTGRLEEARGELLLEYTDQDNRFGNAVQAHAALTLPFEY